MLSVDIMSIYWNTRAMNENTLPPEEELKKTYRLSKNTQVYRNLLIRKMRRQGIPAPQIVKIPKLSSIFAASNIYRLESSPIYSLIERDFPEAIESLTVEDIK